MSDKIKDGGPAFPVITPENWQEKCEGMTLRDYFATKALQAIIAKIPLHDRQGEHGIHAPTVDGIHQVRLDVAQSAYDYADAMLRIREQS